MFVVCLKFWREKCKESIHNLTFFNIQINVYILYAYSSLVFVLGFSRNTFCDYHLICKYSLKATLVEGTRGNSWAERNWASVLIQLLLTLRKPGEVKWPLHSWTGENPTKMGWSLAQRLSSEENSWKGWQPKNIHWQHFP